MTLGKKDSLQRIYSFSFILTIAILFAVGIWSGPTALLTVLVLSALEITFSFDNAVVNAKILQKMPPFWQQAFMTVGIFIAVFGMRVLLPVVLVALTSGLSMGNTVYLMMNSPSEYAHHLELAHPIIASFGGMFLMMIFIEFILDHGRDVHWIAMIEKPLKKVGRLRQASALIALVLLAAVTEILGGEHKYVVLMAGIIGLITYLALRTLTEVFELKQQSQQGHIALGHKAIMKAGFINFLYLELLDASFSLDGVIGAFAITDMVVLIAAGLGIGALWVRSMTIHMVRKNTLMKYRYLEHGAHYAIGVLAALMLLGIRFDIPEAITGTIGILIIAFALFSSWQYNRKNGVPKTAEYEF